MSEIPQPFRKLYLIQPNGTQVNLAERFDAKDSSIDLTGLANANAQAPLVISIVEMCDHNAWHEIGRAELPCWSDASFHVKGKQDKPSG